MDTVFKVEYDYFVTGEQSSINLNKTTYVRAEDIKEALLVAEREIPGRYAQLSTQALTVVITGIIEIGELLN